VCSITCTIHCTDATIRIQDDGDAGVFEFNSTTYSVSEKHSLVAVTVTRTGPASSVNTYTSGIVNVSIQSVLDSATDDSAGCSSVSPCRASAGVDYKAVEEQVIRF
jgi:hypothetical protein